MRNSLRVVAAAAAVVGLAAPAWAGDSPNGHYQRHKRYQGDYYDYNDQRDAKWSEPGPYDGSYDCRHRPHGSHHTETWCDHSYGYQPEG
ncbi:MAG TPA: hypothetical protein VGF00_11350 [Acidimicrobiia bacterium]|nr:hypothetical protein [Actinomycetota bacterium]